MGSLRNPIGPLPSSIYWRRRAVVLAILAVLVLMAVWAVNMSNTGGSGDSQNKGSAGGPATSITPGPNETDSGISQKPGGRDESGDGGSSGGSGGSGGGSGSGGGTGGGSAGSGGSDGSGDGTPIGEVPDSGAAGSGGVAVPDGSSLADCAGGTTELKLRSVKNTYGPDDRPKFELTVKNTSGQACKVDLGRTSAVLTISHTEDDDQVYASDDCPPNTGAALVQVPAKSSITRAVEWDRKPSAPECATPSAKTAKPGTYLAEATIGSLKPDSTSFVLAKD